MRVLLAVLLVSAMVAASYYFFLNSAVQSDLSATNLADAWVILSHASAYDEDGLAVSVHKGHLTDLYDVNVQINDQSCTPNLRLPAQHGRNKLTCFIPDFADEHITHVMVEARPLREPGAGYMTCGRNQMSSATGVIYACDWRRYSFFRDQTDRIALRRGREELPVPVEPK